MSFDLDAATLTEAVASLASGEVGSVEMLSAQLDRVDIFNPSVNAVVAFDVERAMAAATAADDAQASGVELGPLHGIPLTVKDTYETEGCVTVAGAPALANHVPEADADVVAGLRAAGALIYGKTNVPLYAGDPRPTTTSTVSRVTPGIPTARRVVRRAVLRFRWRAASRWAKSVPTSVARSGFPPISMACSASSRPGVSSLRVATSPALPAP